MKSIATQMSQKAIPWCRMLFILIVLAATSMRTIMVRCFTDTNGHFRYVCIREINLSSLHFTNSLCAKQEMKRVTSHSDFVELQEETDTGRQPHLRLRLDYTNLERLSPFAKAYERVQNDCSINRLAIARQRDFAGLGSDIHVYSAAMCKAMEKTNARLRTVGTWIWNSKNHCPVQDENNNTITDTTSSPMLCYFPQSETVCPNDTISGSMPQFKVTDDDGRMKLQSCPKMTQKYGGTSAIRAATTEYLFTRLSDFVIQEAERQLHIHFGNNARTNYQVPKNLITVHVRWGDKRYEVNLLPIERYTNAVHEIVNDRKRARRAAAIANSDTTHDDHSHGSDNDDSGDENVHIYLSTEDPEAVEAFMSNIPRHWNVYLDQYYTEMLPYRNQTGDVHSVNTINAKLLEGRSGLLALGSLLVGMESNDFVVTTKSNWSRLINEIRKNILHPRCQNCTRVIDLLQGEM